MALKEAQLHLCLSQTHLANPDKSRRIPLGCMASHILFPTLQLPLTFQMPSIYLAPIRFCQITKPRSKPLALEMNLA